MVAPLFERLGCEVTVELDLSLKIQRLDMVVVTKQDAISFDGVDPDYYQGFENLNEHNLISFKSFNESFNMEAIEEFYGHFTNYKKMREIKNEGNINLYAVTHHFPEKLFGKYRGTKFLHCIADRRIYDLKVFTPVRFIITNAFEHPILGLFSNNIEQIGKSRNRLEKDGWLLENVSSYLEELYNHYSLEGVNMPYTKEMFVKDHYPEHYDKFLLGEKKGLQKGLQKGRQEGELIGRIQLFQKILKQPMSIKTELLDKSIAELQSMFDILEKEWFKIEN